MIIIKYQFENRIIIYSTILLIIIGIIVSLIISNNYKNIKSNNMSNKSTLTLSPTTTYYKNINEKINTTSNKIPLKQILSSIEIGKLSKSILYISTGNTVGSGFVISKNGLVVTNSHVIKNAIARELIIKNEDNQIFIVDKILYNDEKTDIALLQLTHKNCYYLNIGDSKTLQKGDICYALGNPSGLVGSLSEGIISGFRILQSRESGDYDIQFTASMDLGSSGGSLINQYGEVVGITYSTVKGFEGLHFAVPVSEVKTILNNLGLKY